MAIDLDSRIRRDSRAHLADHLAADAHAPLAHELLGRAPRCHTAVGEHLLQPDQPGSLALADSAPSRTSAPIVLFPAPAGPSIATVRGVATLRTSERADLSRRELAPRSRSKPTELERPEPHATKPQHAEADGGAHASHLSLPTGVEHHPDDRPARAAGH